MVMDSGLARSLSSGRALRGPGGAARNDVGGFGPTGKSAATLYGSAVQPRLQKYCSSLSGRNTSITRAVPPERGAYRDRHERGAGCGGRESVGAPWRSQGALNLVSDLEGAQDERRCSVRQNRVVLTPVAGAKSAVTTSTRPGWSGSLHPPTTVTRRIRRRGERGISRKTNTQGMPGASAEPVCSCAHSLSPMRTRPPVQRAPGIPCAL